MWICVFLISVDLCEAYYKLKSSKVFHMVGPVWFYQLRIRPLLTGNILAMMDRFIQK